MLYKCCGGTGNKERFLMKPVRLIIQPILNGTCYHCLGETTIADNGKEICKDCNREQ